MEACLISIRIFLSGTVAPIDAVGDCFEDGTSMGGSAEGTFSDGAADVFPLVALHMAFDLGRSQAGAGGNRFVWLIIYFNSRSCARAQGTV